MYLIELDPAWEARFLAMAREYAAAGENRYERPAADFAAYLAKLTAASRPDQPAGLVPWSVYWLTDGVDLLGAVRLRHHLSPELEQEGGHIGYDIRPSRRGKGYATTLLKLALQKARDRGMSRVLITCDSDNLASARVIQKNGGRLQDRVISPESGKPVSRYWITLDEPSQAWRELAPDYERARAKEDSLDSLVEWPAQRELLGEIAGRSVLDLGCGNGAKLAELVAGGATASVGIDISGNFLPARLPHLEFIRGDLSELDSMPGLTGRRFDRILFLQSFGYARDPVRTLRAARAMLTDDGFILLTRTQPLRYALQRVEQNGTSLGEEYFRTSDFSYVSRWNDQISLTKRPYTISDLINTFSAAGLWIETALEPQLSDDARRRYPHKQAWMNKYLGILIFKLRARPGQ